MKTKILQSLDFDENDFFIPISNLYFDEALKELKANEFKTYMAITYVVKQVGPNTKLYFSNKKNLYNQIEGLTVISQQTFLKHLKTFETIGLLNFDASNTLNFGYNISDSKSYGFTAISINLLKSLLSGLDQNEFKLYLTLFRLLKGFNQDKAAYTYAQLKKWSGIKNKAIFISTRDSLVEKKLISALMDLDSGKYTFKLNEEPNFLASQNTEKKPHHTKKQPQSCDAHTEKEPFINKYSFSSNKYLKKSSREKPKTLFEKKAKEFEKQNREKIFLFISENFQTKHLSKPKKLELIELLIQEVKSYGGFQNVKVKSTIDFYLAQEHEVYGRNIDKIIDRYFWRMGEEKRKDESRQLFFNALKEFFPEEVCGLEDFKTNDFSKSKLDKLLKNVPAIGYFSEDYVFEVKQIENPDFDSKNLNRFENYLNELISDATKGNTICMEKRLNLLNELMPLAMDKYPITDQFIEVKSKMSLKEFFKHYG